MIRQLRQLHKIIKPQNTLQNRYGFAQDWSHIYNGIYQFEDNTLGEDNLAIR